MLFVCIFAMAIKAQNLSMLVAFQTIHCVQLFNVPIYVRLHAIDEYLQAADGLVRNNGSSRNIFLTTDNGTLIQEIESGAFHKYNFTFYYTRQVNVTSSGRFGNVEFESA